MKSDVNLLTRRKAFLLAGGAAAAGASLGATGSCSTTAASVTAVVIDAIQNAVATTCSFIPSAQTILAIVGQFPAISGVTSVATDTLSAVQAFLCASFDAAGGVSAAVAGHKLSAKLDAGTAFEVHGLVINNGKFVPF